MFEIKGKYATALITTENIEEEAIAQVTELVNHPASKGSKLAIMPDAHAGKGCVIGTTMTIIDRVVPNLCGVDIGCGVLAVEIAKGELNFAALQAVIDKYVPSGMNVFNNEVVDEEILKGLITPLGRAKSRILSSVGTLGGGNHFIAIESDGVKNYLIVHSGSRNLGVQIARYHQDNASFNVIATGINNLIAKLKSEGKQSTIQDEVKAYKLAHADDVSANKELSFLEGQAMADYLNDVGVAQEYASKNRQAIVKAIFENMGWVKGEVIESVHNYIDLKEMILRKGAISSKGMFLVPLNMRDGTLICEGNENIAWNNSAPHGAGRTMSRSRAKKELSMEEFTSTMNGIWSASVNESTLDEAPDAYKPAEEIKGLIAEQYTVVRHLKPLYNFKAQE